MPSSPPSTGTDLLGQLTRAYDQAYEALAQGDVERVQSLLLHTDQLLNGFDAAAVAEPLRREALTALGRLQGAMQKVKDATREELAQVRHGARVLHGYAQSHQGLGQRLESRG